MIKPVLFAALLAAVALTACGQKEEVAVPEVAVPEVAVPEVAVPEVIKP